MQGAKTSAAMLLLSLISWTNQGTVRGTVSPWQLRHHWIWWIFFACWQAEVGPAKPPQWLALFMEGSPRIYQCPVKCGTNWLCDKNEVFTDRLVSCFIWDISQCKMTPSNLSGVMWDHPVLNVSKVWTQRDTGPLIVTVIWRCGRMIIQWQCSFCLKAALPLVKRLVMASDRSSSNVGPKYGWFQSVPCWISFQRNQKNIISVKPKENHNQNFMNSDILKYIF